MRVLAVNISSWNPSKEVFDRLLSCVDLASEERVRKFYFPEDAKRCLIGRLLPRYLLAREFSVPWREASLSATPEGRPYVSAPPLPSPLDFNITHDGAHILLTHTINPSARVGIDVTRLTLPRDTSVSKFLSAFSEQLSSAERTSLFGLPASQQLHRLLTLWTLKEAYTKALGLGLGFDFSRVSFAFDPLRLEVDGRHVPLDDEEGAEWHFWRRELEGYLVAVAVKGAAGDEVDGQWWEDLDVEELVRRAEPVR